MHFKDENRFIEIRLEIIEQTCVKWGLQPSPEPLFFTTVQYSYLFSLGLSFLICTVGCRTRCSLNPFFVSETLWHSQSCV